MWTRKDIKTKGKKAFLANYWNSVAILIFVAAITAICTTFGNVSTDSSNGGITIEATVSLAAAAAISVIGLFVINPMICGSKAFYLSSAENEKADIKEVFYFFKKDRYLNCVTVTFMTGLFVCLWSLLFVVPGIIKSYEYRMVPYILAENPEMTWNEVLNKSKEIMNGQKGNAFVLDLSFIGWEILNVCTLGILGAFYVNPYIEATDAELYLALKK